MPHSVWSFAIVLHKIGKAFAKRMLDEYEQGLESKPQSACFRVCEVLERKLTEAFLQQLQCLHTFSSIIWLHDGIWVAPPPAPATIEATNDHVCRTFNIDTMPPLFRLTKLQPSVGAGLAQIQRNSSFRTKVWQKGNRSRYRSLDPTKCQTCLSGPLQHLMKQCCISPQLAWKQMQLPIITFCVPKNKLWKTNPIELSMKWPP